MQYLHKSLVLILKELKAVNYTLGPVAECVSCKKSQLLEYITYENNQFTIADHLKCSNCAYRELIKYTTAAIKSKVSSVMSIVASSIVHVTSSVTLIFVQVYEIDFRPFYEEIKKLAPGIQDHLEKKLRKNKTDDTSLKDIIQEWFEQNKEDPWPRIIEALNTYEDCDDVIRDIEKKQLFMCDHTITQ